MDYIPGGDLMSLLIKFGIFEEHLARFVSCDCEVTFDCDVTFSLMYTRDVTHMESSCEKLTMNGLDGWTDEALGVDVACR